MLNNTYSRKLHTEIKEKIRELGNKKRNLEIKISSFRISSNQRKHKSETISQQIWEEFDKCKMEIAEIEKQLVELNKEKNQHQSILDLTENSAIRELFNEIFSHEQVVEIWKEIRRRIDGERPTPLGLNLKDLERYKNDYYTYRKLAKEQVEKMIEFRVVLTSVIEKGCNQFGNAEFLKVISPLNQLIIPIKELHKIKVNHSL